MSLHHLRSYSRKTIHAVPILDISELNLLLIEQNTRLNHVHRILQELNFKQKLWNFSRKGGAIQPLRGIWILVLALRGIWLRENCNDSGLSIALLGHNVLILLSILDLLNGYSIVEICKKSVLFQFMNSIEKRC